MIWKAQRSSMRVAVLALVLVLAAALSGAGAFESQSQSAQGQRPKPSSPEAAQKTTEVDEDPLPLTKREKPAAANSAAVEIKPGQFANFGFPVINNKGEVAFLGRFLLSSAQQEVGQAIFVKSPDGGWRFLRAGDKAADEKTTFVSFTHLAINNNGDLLVSASVRSLAESQGAAAGDSSGTGIFSATAEGIKLHALLGGEVPRMPSRFSGFSNPSFNSKGQIAFIASYADPDGRGLFIVEGDRMTLVARSGQKIAPGETAVFSEHYYPSKINERGEIAWFSRISGGGGIFVKRAAGIEAIAIQGKPSPLPGANYLGFGQIAPSINDKGEVAFVGFYDGPDAGRALFVKGDGPVKLVAKTGDRVGDYTFSNFNSPVINNRGEIVFIGSYGGFTRGLFLKTEKGIEIIALYEQRVPGGTKEELFNHFFQPSLNDRGEVVFLAQLKNGNVGLFIRDAKGLRPLVKRGDKLPEMK